MLAMDITPNLAAVQFLPLDQLAAVERIVATAVIGDRRLQAAMAAAKRAADADQAAYEDWLCRQYEQRFDADVPSY